MNKFLEMEFKPRKGLEVIGPNIYMSPVDFKEDHSEYLSRVKNCGFFEENAELLVYVVKRNHNFTAVFCVNQHYSPEAYNKHFAVIYYGVIPFARVFYSQKFKKRRPGGSEELPTYYVESNAIKNSKRPYKATVSLKRRNIVKEVVRIADTLSVGGDHVNKVCIHHEGVLRGGDITVFTSRVMYDTLSSIEDKQRGLDRYFNWSNMRNCMSKEGQRKFIKAVMGISEVDSFNLSSSLDQVNVTEYRKIHKELVDEALNIEELSKLGEDKNFFAATTNCFHNDCIVVSKPVDDIRYSGGEMVDIAYDIKDLNLEIVKQKLPALQFLSKEEGNGSLGLNAGDNTYVISLNEMNE